MKDKSQRAWVEVHANFHLWRRPKLSALGLLFLWGEGPTPSHPEQEAMTTVACREKQTRTMSCHGPHWLAGPSADRQHCEGGEERGTTGPGSPSSAPAFPLPPSPWREREREKYDIALDFVPALLIHRLVLLCSDDTVSSLESARGCPGST